MYQKPSGIYIVSLPVSDTKDKHNTWKTFYSARIDLNSVDSVKLMELNSGKRFNPSDLKSKDKNIRERAVKFILSASEIIN